MGTGLVQEAQHLSRVREAGDAHQDDAPVPFATSLYSLFGSTDGNMGGIDTGHPDGLARGVPIHSKGNIMERLRSFARFDVGLGAKCTSLSFCTRQGNAMFLRWSPLSSPRISCGERVGRGLANTRGEHRDRCWLENRSKPNSKLEVEVGIEIDDGSTVVTRSDRNKTGTQTHRCAQ